MLERSKTTGPGKRVRHLPIFIAASVGSMSSTWLEQGLKLWLSENILFERDFFLPMPHSDWSGVRRVMAHYADVVGLSQHLLRMLRLPVKKGCQWVFSDQPLLPAQEARPFWKEHSEETG